jgi:hypothetical protein
VYTPTYIHVFRNTARKPALYVRVLLFSLFLRPEASLILAKCIFLAPTPTENPYSKAFVSFSADFFFYPVIRNESCLVSWCLWALYLFFFSLIMGFCAGFVGFCFCWGKF